MLYTETRNMYSGSGGFGLDVSNYTDSNQSALFTELDVITTTKDEIVGVQEKAPGGKDSTLPEDSGTTEGTLQKSSLGVVTSVGVFLFSMPKLLIYTIGDFLNVPRQFMIVASSIIIIIVAIILVSSIMRNRL